MLGRQAEGKFQNGVGHGGEWTDWNGNPTGYEGFLADNYRFLQAAPCARRHFAIAFTARSPPPPRRSEGNRWEPSSPLCQAAIRRRRRAKRPPPSAGFMDPQGWPARRFRRIGVPDGTVLPAPPGTVEVRCGTHRPALSRKVLKRSAGAVASLMKRRRGRRSSLVSSCACGRRTARSSFAATCRSAPASPLREDLTLSLPNWPAKLPAAAWLPLYNGTSGSLGSEAAGYEFQGPLPPHHSRLAMPMATYRLAGLMKTGTGSATSCTSVRPEPPLVAVPVPVFITKRRDGGRRSVFCDAHRRRSRRVDIPQENVGLEDGVERRSLVTVLHDGTPDEALDAYFRWVLPDVPPGRSGCTRSPWSITIT